jgi:hypothetical protein
VSGLGSPIGHSHVESSDLPPPCPSSCLVVRSGYPMLGISFGAGCSFTSPSLIASPPRAHVNSPSTAAICVICPPCQPWVTMQGGQACSLCRSALGRLGDLPLIGEQVQLPLVVGQARSPCRWPLLSIYRRRIVLGIFLRLVNNYQQSCRSSWLWTRRGENSPLSRNRYEQKLLTWPFSDMTT